MYKMNDVVLYGNEGVCIVSDICIKRFNGIDDEYIVLKPVCSESSTLYIPLSNKELIDRIKKVLKKEEILELIKSMKDMNEEWINSDSLRKDRYKDVLKCGDREELVCMIKNLSEHSLQMKESGKKFHVCDERMMNDARKKLYEEFAYVLDMEFDSVQKYIEDVSDNNELIKK